MDKNEFNRLDRAKQKADKRKSQEPLHDWAIQLEKQMIDRVKKEHEEIFEIKMKECVNWYLTAIAYSLHFNEKTKFGAKRLQDFMDDLQATVELFSTQEYTAEDYKKQLEADGIYLRERIHG